MQVDGLVAIVTGGASGLGRATATRLVAGGARVTLLDLPTSDGAAVAEQLGGGTVFAPADVTDAEAVAAALDVAEESGPLRLAVSCAGIGPPSRMVGRDGAPAALSWFQTTIQVNLVGTFNVARLAAARMAAHDPVGEERGLIVNTASIAAYEGQIGQVAYSASKGGIVGMTLPMARDLAQHRVRVVTVAPGIFLTPLLQGLPQEAIDSLGAGVPHPARVGDPAEFAQLVQSIVENPMLNGETIRLDGALRMTPR
jgi:NAD(P)-dependent dehydrogenase (short-subunit alcohol dehydrogenase family)